MNMKSLVPVVALMATACVFIPCEPEFVGSTGDESILNYRLIRSNTGGNIIDTKWNLRAMQHKDYRVELLDNCVSACTMVLHEEFSNICWYEDTVFAFHGAVDGPGRQSLIGNFVLWEFYPDELRSVVPGPVEMHSEVWTYLTGGEIVELTGAVDRLCAVNGG